MGAEVDDILKSVIEKGFAGTQLELCEHLRDYGLWIDQSAVSRALRRLGAEKKTVSGRRVYTLPFIKKHTALPNAFSELVLRVSKNETTVVVKTISGAAQFLASIIDHKTRNAIIGTLAGDDTILVVPASTKEIGKTIEELEIILQLSKV